MYKTITESSFSHTIDEIDNLFRRKFFQNIEDISKEVLYVKILSASRIAHVRYQSGSIEISVYFKQLTSNDDEEFERHKKLIKKEYSLLQKYYSRFQNNPKVKIIEPLACFPDMVTHITRAEEGILFDSYFTHNLLKSLLSRKIYTRLLRIFEVIGYWLYDVTKIESVSDSDESIVVENIHYIENQLNQLKEVNYLTMEQIGHIKEYLHQISRDLKNARVNRTLYHGDFTPGNMLLQNDHIVIMDFSDGGVGTIYYDIALIIEWLEFYKRKFFIFRKNISKFQNAVLEAFIHNGNFNELVFNLFQLRAIVNSLRNHSCVMKNVAETKFVNRFLNRWKYNQIISRISSLCQI